MAARASAVRGVAAVADREDWRRCSPRSCDVSLQCARPRHPQKGLPPMTPEQFIATWKLSTLGERQAAQPHFLGLCELLGEPKPEDPENYCFERGAVKTSGQRSASSAPSTNVGGRKCAIRRSRPVWKGQCHPRDTAIHPRYYVPRRRPCTEPDGASLRTQSVRKRSISSGSSRPRPRIAHSQTIMLRQPAAASSSRFRASRAWFPSILARQNSARCWGQRNKSHRWPCQKQP